MYVSINSKLTKNPKISALDHGLMVGDGVFETLRTYNGKIFKFDEHYKRLLSSAKFISLPVPTKKETIKKDIIKLLKKNKLTDARIRLTITRGIGPGGLSINCKNQSIIITTEKIIPIKVPSVKIITLPLTTALPGIKSLSYVSSVYAKLQAKKSGAFEAIFTDKYVREGSFSNIFMVKNNTLYTPKNKILKGITRQIIIDLAKQLKIKTIQKDITKTQLKNADEIFITFTTAGILPVHQIDNIKKQVGTTTKRLQNEYSKFIKGR